MRILLFLLTNIGVLFVVTAVAKLFGLDQYLYSYGMNWQGALISCAIFGFAGSLISLFLSKPMAKRASHTRVIETPQNAQEQWLVNTVKNLADKAGIAMPEVGIFPSQQSNAFATGWNKNKALVAISQGMLDRFERDEIEAVMAHEIGHAANGDMVTLTLLQGVVNTFVLFFARIICSIVDNALSGGRERGHGIGFFVTYFIAQIVLGFVASAIVMTFSRHREYRADYAGATFGSQQGMIKALQHLQNESNVAQLQRQQMPDTLTAFGISGGSLKARFGHLFSSHPPLESRIEALKRL